MIHRIKLMSGSMSSVWEKLADLTLPLVSIFNGSRFTKGIRSALGEMNIENFPVQYFCITTDVGKGKMQVHRSGPAWKYVRASMSLQGYLPPMPDGDSLLLDGGYMNQVPADVMKHLGASIVIAVDVSRVTVTQCFDYGVG